MATTTSGIGFGTLSTAGGTTRLSGTSSDIDTAALIDALVKAKNLPADRLDAKITRNEAKTAALTEMRGLLQKLQTAVAGLRNPPGALGTAENAFEKKDVFFTSDTTVSPASLLGVSVTNDVPPSRFDMVVKSLATAQKVSSASLADATSALSGPINGLPSFAGGLTIGLAGGATATVAVDGTMSLEAVRNAINEQSSVTKVTASVVKVSDTDSRLVLSGAETGKALALGVASGDDVLARLGLSADGGATFRHELVAAKQAEVVIDGVSIKRPGNQVTDAIAGVTLNLYKADPATTVTVEVDRSLSGVKDQLTTFVDAYNAFRDFVRKQSTVSDSGEVSSDAALFGSAILRGIDQGVSGLLGGSVAGLASTATSTLAGLGITLDADNHLAIDGARLDAELGGDLDAVRDVLEFRFTSSSPSLGVYARTNDLAATAFRVSIVDADADGVPESATAGGVALDVSGGTLTGKAGTAYAGLQMLWQGKGSADIDVTATQGIADKLYNLLDGATDQLDGTLAKATDDLGRQNTAYQAEIEKIKARGESYRQQLVAKYSAMETALALSKSMLQQVQATVAAYSQNN